MATDRIASLKAHFSSADQELRPILTSLNGDNSWLISFPRPEAERKSLGKAYFHAVHDPWLKGSTSFLHSWLLTINLTVSPSMTDGDGVEAAARDIEIAAAAAGLLPTNESTTNGDVPTLDAIFIHVDAIDHLHEPTLRTFDPRIPVFGAPAASMKIRQWAYFDAVISNKELEADDGNWQNLHPGAPLPEWLTLFHMKAGHYLNFASAMIWSSVPGVHEALLYSPHGVDIKQPCIRTLLQHATPDIKVLAILHGLKENWAFGNLVALGVKYGLPLYRESKAKYWVLSHDTNLKLSGLINRGIWDIFRTMEWGLGQERETGDHNLELEKVNLVEVENGSFTVLS